MKHKAYLLLYLEDMNFSNNVKIADVTNSLTPSLPFKPWRHLWASPKEKKYVCIFTVYETVAFENIQRNHSNEFRIGCNWRANTSSCIHQCWSIVIFWINVRKQDRKYARNWTCFRTTECKAKMCNWGIRKWSLLAIPRVI